MNLFVCLYGVKIIKYFSALTRGLMTISTAALCWVIAIIITILIDDKSYKF